MKLIFKYALDGVNYKNIELLNKKTEEIDVFTSNFLDKKDLFEKVILPELSKYKEIDLDKIKYSFYMQGRDITKINPNIIYQKHRFLTHDSGRKDAYIKLKYLDPKRIYDYIEKNYTNVLTKDFIPKTLEEKKYYYLSREIEQINDNKLTKYQKQFTYSFNNDYYSVRDMSFNIFNDKEIEELNRNINKNEKIIDVNIYEQLIKHNQNDDQIKFNL